MKDSIKIFYRMIKHNKKAELRQFNKQFPSVLLASPFHECKAYIIDRYLQNLQYINYPRLKFLFVDNSKTDDFVKSIKKKYNIDVCRNPEYVKTSRERQCISLNIIREQFLRLGFDYLFLLECDLIPKPTIVQDLMQHNKKICAAPYLLKKEKGIYCLTTNTYIAVKDGFANVFHPAGYLDGELKEVDNNAGLGCVLIHRSVLEKFEFRWGGCHADSYFYPDARAFDIKAYVDTSLIIPHYPRPKLMEDY